MNNYEVMYIVKPVEEEAFEALVAKFDNLINNNGGTVEKTDHIGCQRIFFKNSIQPYSNSCHFFSPSFYSAGTITGGSDHSTFMLCAKSL